MIPQQKNVFEDEEEEEEELEEEEEGHGCETTTTTWIYVYMESNIFFFTSEIFIMQWPTLHRVIKFIFRGTLQNDVLISTSQELKHVVRVTAWPQ